MTTILGIDAAWTKKEPSGVALIQGHSDSWVCLSIAPSYQSFIDAANGSPVNWDARPKGDWPNPSALLSAARTLAGAEVDLVTIDMPIATSPIHGRRVADNEVSKRFGARGCSTHSSTLERPGKLGAELTAAFGVLGYPVATVTARPDHDRHLVEIYPHPALLALLNRPTRVPYKQSKSNKYWPGQPVNVRIRNLLAEYAGIEAALTRIFGTLPSLPSPETFTTLSQLKRLEDALDGLVACWVGMLCATGKATPLGNGVAAIWCPTAALELPPLS